MINAFHGTYRFLSNFSPAPVVLDGARYPNVEQAYQAAKTLDLDERRRIRESAGPGEAKRLGRAVKLRPGWDGMKLEIMEDLLRQKFAVPWMRDALLATRPHELVEGNAWNDTFWGVVPDRGGQNHLGKLLMRIRDEC